METKTFPYIPATQPIGTMYVCVIDSLFLRKITTSNTRRKTDEFSSVEEYVGIQRELDIKRKKEIGRYVNLADASFPNSIILTISSTHITINDNNTVNIDDIEGIASVIDGQHRIAGLDDFSGDHFDCIVTIFIDMEMEDQAVIFSTINTEQKKVNKSLVADLYELYQTRNPQRTCHNIARLLTSNSKSPFYQKISILGAADKNKGETLTQYIFVKELLNHITKNPLEDRDVMKRKDFWGRYQKLELRPGEEQKFCLRKLFIEDETDSKITQIIINYFKALKNKWPNSWNADATTSNIINKSTGYIAFMKFFNHAYLLLNTEVPSVEEFGSIFDKLELADGSFTRENYVPGATGQDKLYKELMKALQ